MLALVTIAWCAVGSTASAQALPSSSAVTMTNVYDAFGSEKPGLTQE